MRRYDVDWLRVLALGLLVIYHAVVSFQPWGHFIAFPVNKDPLEGLWILMALINIWRIPILFIISGMGLRFAMARRNWKALLKDRTFRILIPYIFGFLIIGPVNLFISSLFYYEKAGAYIPNPGHLWFLGNIYIYVLLTLAILVYIKNHPDNLLFRFLASSFKRPFGIYIMVLPFLLEVWLMAPESYSTYVGTDHGFWLGVLCFIAGFIFVSLKDVFWNAVDNIKKWALALAGILYLIRVLVFALSPPNILIAIESFSWMLPILGFSSAYLNNPSKLLTYLSRAVYPVYIIHLPMQYLASLYILNLEIPATLKLATLIVVTIGGSLLIYHFMLNRIGRFGILFGIYNKKKS